MMSMTPMIDVVFLLLIFFMTVSQVSKLNRENLELPRLKGSEDQRPAILTINVTQEGRIVVSGRTYSPVDLVEVVQAELQKLNEEAKRLKQVPQRLNVVLRADERATCGTVNKVVKVLLAEEVKHVRMAVEVPQG